MNIFTSTAPTAEFDKTIAKIEGDDTLVLFGPPGDLARAEAGLLAAGPVKT
jgi:hypothetical protein